MSTGKIQFAEQDGTFVLKFTGEVRLTLCSALDATIVTQKADGDKRRVPIGDFYRLPGDTPQIENVLEPGELITHVELPAPVANARHLYRKVRDRASYAFALVSVAGVVAVEDGCAVRSFFDFFALVEVG